MASAMNPSMISSPSYDDAADLDYPLEDALDGVSSLDEDRELQNLFRYWRKQPNVNASKVVSFAQLDQDNNCNRCGKKVYPVEKLDIGVLYHKACFKCLVCSRQLTLQNFQREIDLNNSRIKEVYCNVHVPRQGHGNFDQDALGIRSAIDAQRRASKKVHRHVYPDHNYVPDYPQRGSGDWSSASSGGNGSRPASGEWDATEVEASAAAESVSTMVGRLHEKENAAHTEILPVLSAPATSRHGDDHGAALAAAVAKPVLPVPAEVSTTRGSVVAGEQTETGEGVEVRKVLLRRQDSASQRNSTIRRRSTLRSFQDFEKFGVFDAQSMLEKAQRQEEDELYTQIEAERRSLRTRLDECLRKERDQSVRDLVAFFEKNDVGEAERQDALIKVEEYYRRRREAALRELLQRLAAEEQAAVARMVEKHSNEMIQLIRKKERSANQTLTKPDTSRASPVPKTVKQIQHVAAPSRASPVPVATSTLKPSTGHKHNDGPPPIPARDEHSARTTSSPSIMSSASAFSVPKKSAKSPGVIQIIPISRHSPAISRHSPAQYQDDQLDVSPERTSDFSIQGIEGFSAIEGRSKDDSDDSLEISEAIPEAEPPMCPKEDLYSDPEVFKEQDRRAIEESKKDHKTFTDLVRQLSRRCQTELQKVRSIFRWVTVKDLNRMKFDERLDPNSPLGLLRGIKMGTESYHDLFRRLCSYAGLHCEVIEGFSKGAGYRPGAAIQGDTFRNQWTAVWVDGSWRFINCKWGARHVKATRDTSLTYKCDEFYFLTDPEDHIYQHFPDDPVWQLLPDPISLNAFMQLPVLKSPFFNHKLHLSRPYKAILEAQDGQIEIRLQSQSLFGIAAKLKSTNKDIPTEILSDRTMVRYADGEFVVLVNLPSPGQYFLDLFAASEWDSNRMDNACAFQVRCSGISRNADVTYPPIGCFGRTPSFVECGLVEDSHLDPYVTCTGTITVGFRLTKNVSLKATLRRWDPRDQSMTDYDRFTLFRQRTSHSAVFELQFPRKGLYVYSTYVVNPEDPSASMVCLYRYLLDCSTPQMDALPYPKASKRFKHCRVVEPLSGDLSPETEATFVFESKRAVDMMVVFNNKSHGLKSNGKLWRKTVFINMPTGKVMVYARFDPTSDKYIPMLEYQIANVKKYPGLF